MVDVEIVPRGTLDTEMMGDLAILHDRLLEADLQSKATDAVIPGTKDAGLTVAISIAGLALSAASTLVSVLSYWSSQRPKYSVTLHSEKMDQKVSGLDKNGVLEVVEGLVDHPDHSQIVVRVEKG